MVSRTLKYKYTYLHIYRYLKRFDYVSHRVRCPPQMLFLIFITVPGHATLCYATLCYTHLSTYSYPEIEGMCDGLLGRADLIRGTCLTGLLCYSATQPELSDSPRFK